MCLTIPGKVIDIKNNIATVKNSANRKARVDLGLVSGARVGSWILYATDRAVRVISENDAKEIVDLLEEHYRKVDVGRLSSKFKDIICRLKVDKENPKSEILNPKKIQNPNDQNLKKDIEYLLQIEDRDELETLFAEANSLRKEKLEDFVCIHGIIEFSNYCKNNCLYCGIRRDNQIKRYRMTADEIVKVAGEAVENEGYKLLVLQSGEDFHYSDDEMIKMIEKIKKNMRVFIFLSVGERSEDFYQRAFKVGATGSLFRFETSNKKLYKKMHPGHNFSERLKLLKMQKKIGFYIASGSLVGLPGQSISDIADDILMVKKLAVPMLSSGPWLPAAGTPLAENPKSEIRNPKKIQNPKSENLQPNFYNLKPENQLKLILKYMAVCRLLMPEIKIPVTTALETLDKANGRHKGLLAGANALMFNLTPEKYCKKYSIYDNKFRDREKIWQKYGLFRGEESWEMLEAKLRAGHLTN